MLVLWCLLWLCVAVWRCPVLLLNGVAAIGVAGLCRMLLFVACCVVLFVLWLCAVVVFDGCFRSVALFAVYVYCCCSVLLFVCGCWSLFDVCGWLLLCVDCVARYCCLSFVVGSWVSCLVVVVVG